MSSLEPPRVLTSTPPEAWRPLHQLARAAKRPLQRFLEIEAASGFLLVGVACLALAAANSPWASSYAAFWHTSVGIHMGALHFERSLEWFVNDGLMVIFFFVVGLEIRRETHAGELSEWRRAALPAAAAAGGMLAPACLYLALAGRGPGHSGWGVPMATDIAFALGVLALLGKRVPPALRVLLLALAVIDDLGAILVIAIFYSEGVRFSGLAIAGAGLAFVFALRLAGVRNRLVYVLPGFVVWGGIYAAGIHPTIAGVILGCVTPVEAWLGPTGFVAGVREQIDHITSDGREPENLSEHELSSALRHVGEAGREARSPAESLIGALHPWVAFVIMPIFAAANAGVEISGISTSGATVPVALGVLAGLVLGKPIGVLIACRIMLSLGISSLPTGINWRHLVVLGFVAGIGFTMALFVAQLAFSEVRLLAAAKLGVLGASGCAAIVSLAAGRMLLKLGLAPGAATTEEEAERSTDR